MFGTTLAEVPHCWQLSSVPHPLDLSFCTSNTRVLGTRLWTIQQPSYVGSRQHGLHSPEAFTLCFSDAPNSDSDDDDDSDGDALSVPSSSDCDSQSGDCDDKPEVEVVWVKAACEVWENGGVFDGKLYLTRDICKDEQIPR
mmetsp:Transcript_70702/g.118186  ORF Transcript_70702/g.118186 Transcript_70702/m.118186 type:complete len:141 (-) Transcript_70702:36-458(-)